VYDRLARDPDSRVRAAVLDAEALPVEKRAAIVRDLSSDTDRTVLDNVTRALNGLATSAFQEPMPSVWLPALRARRANTASPFDQAVGESSRIYQRLTLSSEGRALLCEWAAGPNGKEPMTTLINSVGLLVARGEVQTMGVDDAMLAKVYLATRTATDDRASFAFVQYLAKLDTPPTAAFLSIAEDASISVPLRVGALAVAARAPGDRVGTLALELLDAPVWKQDPQLAARTGRDVFRLLCQRLNVDQLPRIVDGVLAARDVPKTLASRVLVESLVRIPPTDAQADATLRAWLDDVGAVEFVDKALRQIARRPRAAQGDWLVRATRVPWLCRSAFELIGDQRDPSYIDVLRDGLSGRIRLTQSFEGATPNVREAALNALTRYFDARAADIILEVAGSTPDASLRDDCFKALETIRKYEAEKGRMRKDRITQAATDTAIADLVAMLADADPGIRVQALRGLSTLGAIDQLPAIVKCLKDADERVRKAAENALDTLNAPPSEKKQ